MSAAVWPPIPHDQLIIEEEKSLVPILPLQKRHKLNLPKHLGLGTRMATQQLARHPRIAEKRAAGVRSVVGA